MEKFKSGRLVQSAYKLIADLERFGILREITGGKRGKVYSFDAYIKLFT